MKGDRNIFTATGNLVGEPELDEVTVRGERKAVMKFRILQNLSDKDGDVLGVNVTAWGGRARYVHRQWQAGNLVKGTRVRVDGPVKLHAYAAQDGTPKASLDLTLSHLDFAPIPRIDESAENSRPAARASERRETVGAGARTGSEPNFGGGGGNGEHDDSEIPF